MKTMLFNPYTGTPRHPSDITSDPQGLLIAEPGEPLRPAHDHSHMVGTVEDAARDVAKCLNERDGQGLDLRHVAMLVHHAQMSTFTPDVKTPHEPSPTAGMNMAQRILHAFLSAMQESGMDPALLVAAMADLAPVRERILAAAVTPPAVPELTPIAKRKLADLIAAGHRVNGLAFQRCNDDDTITRGAITAGGMVLWWHPDGASTEVCKKCQLAPDRKPTPDSAYEDLRTLIDAGSETATHADAMAWVTAAHRTLADVHGLTLTNDQCDAFRRLPMPFNDMVRAIYAAGAEHRTEPKDAQ